MKIKENVTRYECDYCRKEYRTKKGCMKHESVCYYGPSDTAPCYACFHLEKVKRTLIEDTGYGEFSREVEVLHCALKHQLMYPKRAEGKQFDFGDESNIQMPKENECKEFNECSHADRWYW